VSGIDFELRDETSATPLVFPLTGLDIEVERFTTKAFTEPKPVSFSAVLTTGNVTLPKRTVASSLLAGVLTAAGHAITGGGDADATEERPFLEELSVQGRLQFYPDLEGRVRTSLTGLELTALRGPAQAAGVEIGDGVFDTGIDVRLEPGVVRTEASFGFADLSLDEPPGGLISTYLKLPAPLDAVLFALKDDVDEIHVPLTLEVGKEGVGGGAIASAAVSALGSIITDAIASAPLRAAGTLTGALGFGPGAAENLAARKRNVRFEPGAVELPPEAAARLLPLVDKIRGDDSLSLVLTHSFGVQDVVLAERLANPDRATTEQLVAGLRQRRAELQIRRDEAGAEARMHLLTGRHYLAQGEVARLRALDRTLAELEDALDDAIKLLRPGAERRAPRRTKTAALGLGNRRLDAMQAWLLEQLGPAAADRIEVRRARLGEPVGPLGGVVSVTPARRQTSGS